MFLTKWRIVLAYFVSQYCGNKHLNISFDKYKAYYYQAGYGLVPGGALPFPTQLYITALGAKTAPVQGGPFLITFGARLLISTRVHLR